MTVKHCYNTETDMDITSHIQYLEQSYSKKLVPFTITIVMHKSFVYAKVVYSDLEYKGIFKKRFIPVRKVDWYQLAL